MKQEIVIKGQDGQPVTTTLAIAQGTEVSHEAVIKLVRAHYESLNQFGEVRFEIRLNPQGAHFATFPVALIEPCILAGAPSGGVVLDPFFGSGTTGQVAQNLGRKFIGCELNQEYKSLQDERLQQPSFEFEVES